MKWAIRSCDGDYNLELLRNAGLKAFCRHRPSVTQRRRDGSLEMQSKTTGWKELVRRILSWQPDVKVLSPKRLGERINLKMVLPGLAGYYLLGNVLKN